VSAAISPELWSLVIERAAQRVFRMPEFYGAFGEASERIRSQGRC
jgi:hypothetical protein